MFFVFAVVYFVKNILTTKVQRMQSFRAALKAIYYIPIFFQGLFLFYSSIAYFYFVAKECFLLLACIISTTEAKNFSITNLLYFISVICFGSLLLSLHAALAKFSANKKMDVDAIAYKICYTILSAFLLRLLYLNVQLFTPFLFEFDALYLFSNIYFIIVFSILSMGLLLLPLFYKTNNKTLLYARLSLKVTITYFLVSFLLAFVIFILYGLLKIMHA